MVDRQRATLGFAESLKIAGDETARLIEHSGALVHTAGHAVRSITELSR